MSQKKKGSNAERELIHLFYSVPLWCAVRVAGSGSSKYPCPDILASNKKRIVAIECKATRDEKKYIPHEEIQQLEKFAETFGAEAWIAVRFLHTKWHFLKTNELDIVGKSVAISKKHATIKGRNFDEFVQIGE